MSPLHYGCYQSNRGSDENARKTMRAEAKGAGELGLLVVGNVGVTRVRGNCLDFKNIRSIPDMVDQSPGGFEAITKGYLSSCY